MSQFNYQLTIYADAKNTKTETGHMYYSLQKIDNNGNVVSQEYFGKNQDLNDTIKWADGLYDDAVIERNAQLANRNYDMSKNYNLTDTQYNQWSFNSLKSVNDDKTYFGLGGNCVDYIQQNFNQIMGGKFTNNWTSQEVDRLGFVGDYIQFKYGSSNQIPYDNFNLKMSRWENSGMAETVYGSYGPYQYTPIKGSFAADYFKPNSSILNSLANLGSALNHKSPLAIDLDGDGIESDGVKYWN